MRRESGLPFCSWLHCAGEQPVLARRGIEEAHAALKYEEAHAALKYEEAHAALEV
jgi:hypothetical protein